MNYLYKLVERYPHLKICEKSIKESFDLLVGCFENGNKLLIAGNGGSCSDGEHIVGELMKGFKLPRKCTSEFAEKLKGIDGVRGAELAEKLQGGLPSIALTCHQSLNTAFVDRKSVV